MRPKKRILLVDGNEKRRSVLYFTLTTHAYEVALASCSAEALHLVPRLDPELVIGCWTPDETLELFFDQVRHLSPAPTMFVAEHLGGKPESIVADVALLGRAATPAEILVRARLLALRKRGRKKGPQGAARAYLVEQRVTA